MAVSEVAGVTRWGWTVSRYEKAAELGLFGPEPKVELIEGEVFDVAAMLPPHASATRRIRSRLARLDNGWTVGGQDPVRLGDISEPEPDVWVAKGGEDQYRKRHPTQADLALAVEVADSTLRFDRDIKIPMYAAHGVPEVWLVSIPDRTVTCYTEPAGRTYQAQATISEGSVEFAGVEIPLEKLF